MSTSARIHRLMLTLANLYTQHRKKALPLPLPVLLLPTIFNVDAHEELLKLLQPPPFIATVVVPTDPPELAIVPTPDDMAPLLCSCCFHSSVVSFVIPPICSLLQQQQQEQQQQPQHWGYEFASPPRLQFGKHLSHTNTPQSHYPRDNHFYTVASVVARLTAKCTHDDALVRQNRKSGTTQCMNTPDSLLATLDHDNGDDVDQLTSFCYPMASFKLPTHYRVTAAPARSWW